MARPQVIDQYFEGLGATAHAHIRDLADGRGLGVRETEQVVLVSVVKVFIAWEFSRQVQEGLIDPGETVRVTAADRLGGTGTAGFRHDALIAVGDLVQLMMEVSDNTAADLVLRHIGPAALRGLPARLGLDATRLLGGPRDILEDLARDLGISDLEALAHVLASGSVSTAELRRTSAWDPWRTNASTAAEMTEFLRRVWTGPEATKRDLREWMGRQLTGGRLDRLAPKGVRFFGKSGSLPGGWINEVGLWERPGGPGYAIAFFVRTGDADVRSGSGNVRAISEAMSRAVRDLVDALEDAAAQ